MYKARRHTNAVIEAGLNKNVVMPQKQPMPPYNYIPNATMPSNGYLMLVSILSYP